MPVNARDLFEAIGMVDEDLVEEADGPVRRPAWTPRRVMGRVLPAAACLCIVGAAVLSFGRGMFSAGSSGGAMLQNEMAGGAADAAPRRRPIPPRPRLSMTPPMMRRRKRASTAWASRRNWRKR